MSADYGHTQTGTLVLALLVMVVLIILVVPIINGWDWVFAPILGGIVIVGILFGTLTVEIEGGRIRCWFGPGLIRKEFPLAEVTAAVAVRNRWYYGWGIRLTPHGWLFNVSGLDAVEITLASGKHFRIGTNQPKELEATIRQGAGLPTYSAPIENSGDLQET